MTTHSQLLHNNLNAALVLLISSYLNLLGHSVTYHGNHAAGFDAVTHAHAHQVLVVRVFSPPHQHLVAHEVGPLVDHEATSLHPAGVAVAEERGELRAVAASLIGTTLEVLVLVEDDLKASM